MTKVQDSWKEVGDRFQALGLKLKLHVEEERGGTGEDAESIAASFAKVGKAIEDVFEAFGDAFEDEAVRADAKEAGRLLLEAVDTTFGEAGEQLRDRLRR